MGVRGLGSGGWGFGVGVVGVGGDVVLFLVVGFLGAIR